MCVLQVCLRDGGGCAHWSSVTVSIRSGPVFWRHCTCLICSPEPQLSLHTPHSPTLQLWHTTAHTQRETLISGDCSLCLMHEKYFFHTCGIPNFPFNWIVKIAYCILNLKSMRRIHTTMINTATGPAFVKFKLGSYIIGYSLCPLLYTAHQIMSFIYA